MLKRLFTPREKATDERLAPICQTWGARVHSKVRLADVVPIEGSGISDELYRFALQSHFDFLVTDHESIPLFAVEFDGHSHNSVVQRRRDQKKNEICRHFEVPLLRINSRYLGTRYGSMDLLGWFVHTWFITRRMLEAQEAGLFPIDEPIDATFVYTIPGESGEFPLWLSSNIQEEVRSLCALGKCHDPGISCIVGQDANNNYFAFAYLCVTPSSAVYGTVAMRNQLFPVETSSVVEDIAIHETCLELHRVLERRKGAITVAQLAERIAKFEASYKLNSCSIYSCGLNTRQINRLSQAT